MYRPTSFAKVAEMSIVHMFTWSVHLECSLGGSGLLLHGLSLVLNGAALKWDWCNQARSEVHLVKAGR